MTLLILCFHDVIFYVELTISILFLSILLFLVINGIKITTNLFTFIYSFIHSFIFHGCKWSLLKFRKGKYKGVYGVAQVKCGG
jgi:hypothetical protein